MDKTFADVNTLVPLWLIRLSHLPCSNNLKPLQNSNYVSHVHTKPQHISEENM